MVVNDQYKSKKISELFGDFFYKAAINFYC